MKVDRKYKIIFIVFQDFTLHFIVVSFILGTQRKKDKFIENKKKELRGKRALKFTK